MTGIRSLESHGGSTPGSAAKGERSVATGHIMLVQEGRFRLWTDEGRGLLLTLAHNANAGIEDLLRFRRDGTRVEVHYTGTPNLAQATAHRITTAPDARGPA